jgi:hypothetical protein
MTADRAELAVLFEHPESQKPLFQALELSKTAQAALLRGLGVPVN